MSLRLTTDDDAVELSSLEVKLSVDHIAGTVRSQLSTFGMHSKRPEVVAAMTSMRETLGAEMFERLVRDIANNVVQSLL